VLRSSVGRQISTAPIVEILPASAPFGSMTIRILGWALVAMSLLAVGCQQSEQIEAYPVPKESKPRVAPAAAAGPATDRMLAAVLPDGDRAWFFKVTGPINEIGPIAGQVGEFFTSIRPAPGKPRPDWKLPESWQIEEGSGMRAATIQIPAGSKSLELSVIALPWRGMPGEMLSNVNRWRGQMKMPPTDEAGLAQDTRVLKVGDATLTAVDLNGNFESGGMTAPFAGGAANSAPPVAAPPPAAASQANDDLPPGHPPVAAQPAAAKSAAPFTFDLPTGWQERPASGMRKVDLAIDEGGKSAVFTAIDFPADSPPMMSDPVANVRRWRGEVGLPPLSDNEIKATMQPIEIDGTKAMFVEAIPDAGQPQSDRATIAAMFTRGDAIWFFKLSGDRDAVAAQQDKFNAFLKLVRFTDPGGANDGDQ
jgi:hypothetical protein